MHRVYRAYGGVNFDGEVEIDSKVELKREKILEEEMANISDDTNIAEYKRLLDNKNLQREKEYEEKVKNLVNEYNSKNDEIAQKIKEMEIQNTARLNMLEKQLRDDMDSEKLRTITLAEEMAKANGFEAGFNEGKKVVSEELNGVITLLEEINKAKEKMYIDYENQIIDVVFELVEKITNTEVQTYKEIIFAMVKNVCKRFRNSDYVKISLAKCDVEQTVVTDEKLIKSIGCGIKNVEIELLKDAPAGTVIVDNEKEIIDASVPSQLEFLQEVLNASKK